MPPGDAWDFLEGVLIEAWVEIIPISPRVFPRCPPGSLLVVLLHNGIVLSRQPIEIRRMNVPVAIAAQVGPVVLGDDEEDVHYI